MKEKKLMGVSTLEEGYGEGAYSIQIYPRSEEQNRVGGRGLPPTQNKPEKYTEAYGGN